MLKHYAANRKRRLSALPSVSPYILYTTLKCLALQGATYIYDISRLRVNVDPVSGFRVSLDTLYFQSVFTNIRCLAPLVFSPSIKNLKKNIEKLEQIYIVFQGLLLNVTSGPCGRPTIFAPASHIPEFTMLSRTIGS
jgi:hypothetical protein